MCSSEKEQKKGTTMVEKYDDAFLEEKWREFANVPINYDDPDFPDGVLECDWFVFEAGEERIEGVWRWFDEHYSGGVHKLMFPDAESDRQLLVDSVMNEITGFCESCPSVECCPEEECVLFRIESLLVE